MTLLISLLILPFIYAQDPSQQVMINCIVGKVNQMGLVQQSAGTGFTPSNCISACSTYAFAYIYGGSNGQCLCENFSKPSGSSTVDFKNCETACADGTSLGCGGGDLNNQLLAVYSTTGNSSQVVTPEAPPKEKIIGKGFQLPPAYYIYYTYAGTILAFAIISSVTAWIMREPNPKKSKK